nr:hypothetical protein Iba_chr04fCG15350 [Ipomoea batatas]
MTCSICTASCSASNLTIATSLGTASGSSSNLANAIGSGTSSRPAKQRKKHGSFEAASRWRVNRERSVTEQSHNSAVHEQSHTSGGEKESLGDRVGAILDETMLCRLAADGRKGEGGGGREASAVRFLRLKASSPASSAAVKSMERILSHHFCFSFDSSSLLISANSKLSEVKQLSKGKKQTKYQYVEDYKCISTMQGLKDGEEKELGNDPGVSKKGKQPFKLSLKGKNVHVGS